MTAQQRKYISLACLLMLLCLFCLISTSVIDVLTDSSHLNFIQTKGIENNGYDGAINTLAKHAYTAKLDKIQLEEILRNDLSADSFNGSWITKDEFAFYDVEYNLCLYNSTSRAVRHAVRFPYVLSMFLKGLRLSSDTKYLLSSSETIELFRYSRLERFKIYDIANNTMIKLFRDGNFENAYFQFGIWGPKGSQLVFAYQNDLYYKFAAYAEPIRLTVTGKPEVIFNGQTDWLYEEEVLNSNTALWFSPEGTDLAYLQINSSAVDVQSWNRYGDYYNTSSNQYPAMQSIRYPKPGTPNPEPTIYVVALHHDVNHIHIRQIAAPSEISKLDYYITKVSWYDNDNLMIAWTGRNQTYSILVICSRKNNWNCHELYRLTATRGWVDGFESGLLSSYENRSILVRIPKYVAREKNEYFHIASIDLESKKINFLTDGKFNVIKLIAFSLISGEVFYASTLTNHPEVQHIMKISLKGQTEPVCLTCFLGNSCRYNEAHFNSIATKFVLECQGYEIPRVELRDAQSNALIETLQQNVRLYQFLKNKHIPRYEKMFVQITGNEDAIVELILPHNFDEDTRYPLVIELYGAPGTQMVKDKYEMNHWSSYLASEKEYIHARVDVRGSANQDLHYMHQLYQNVGRLEVDDLIDVVWFLRNNLTYIDSNRIALWGWSYGGYMSLMSLIREFDNRLFSCAIAVAPVSNWMYYDSAYSERYLGVPNAQNMYSYEDSNLLDHALLLRNKKFLIIFGTSDDNVHMQHSFHLIRKLNELNIDYDVQIYPDDNHYLLKSSGHLYRKMSNYIQQCFNYRNNSTRL